MTSYFDRVVKCVLGNLTFELNPYNYDPGRNKLAKGRRTKNGKMITEGVPKAGDTTKFAIKHIVTLTGLDRSLYDNIIAEFEKAERLYFKSPLGELFDDTGIAGHFSKVVFSSLNHKFTPNLNLTEYTIVLEEG